MSNNIPPVRRPPLNEAEVDSFIWKKWFQDVYQHVYNDTNPNTVVTASTTLALGFLIPCDATSAAITIYLPPANSCKAKRYFIKKIDSSAHAVTVTAAGSDVIDGSATQALSAQWQAIYIESDGLSKWHVLMGAGVSGGGSGTVTSVTAADETIIIGGTATDPTVRANTTDIILASENLTGGMLVNVYNDAGTPKVRKADASLGQAYRCDGFIVDTVTAGNNVKVYYIGVNSHCTGLVAGDVWLGSAGLPTQTPPNTAGYISQKVGDASSATELEFNPSEDILIAAAGTSGSSGSSTSVIITTTTTIVIPSNVTAVTLTMIGGGGGGGSSAATGAAGRGGGGSGEYCIDFPVPVTAGETATVTIGAGGSGGSAGTSGSTGGTTSFAVASGTYSVLGGIGGSANGGTGGGPRGGAAAGAGNPAASGSLGTAESPVHFGGGSGGGGGNAISTTGGDGAGAPGYLIGGAKAVGTASGGGGGGGAATIWGLGGAGSTANTAGVNAASTAYGAGGGGAGGNNAVSQAGGNGAPGYVMVTYVS